MDKSAKANVTPIRQPVAGVYRVWLSPNHFYIGRSSDVAGRCLGHLRRLSKGKHPNPHMQAVFAKYGGEFRYEVVEELTPDKAEVLEQTLLDAHLGNPRCMNICPSSKIPTRKGKRNSPDHRARISKAQKGMIFDDAARKNMSEGQKTRFSEGWPDAFRDAMMAVRDTPEYRQKLSEAQMGKSLSPEHKAKLSAASTGRVTSTTTREKLSKSLTGRVFSSGHRAKISLAHTGRKLSDETKAKMSAAQFRRQERERAERPTNGASS